MQLTDEERIQHRAGQHDRDHRRTLDSNKRDNPSNLWWHFRMMIRNISSRFIGTSNPMGVFEIDLHEAWDTFIEAAKVTPAEDAAADRLVAQVLLARGLGQVSRPQLSPVKGKDGQSENVTVEHAIASSGECMWTDLPFFVTDLRAFWLSSNNTLEKVERTNFAAICGRLSASKICDPDVTCCALILLREALETLYALVDQEYPSAKPVNDYLPAVLAWLSNGTYQILALCMRDHVPDMGVSDGADWRAGGELMVARGGDTIGFSMLRWQFWSDRLRFLETDETGDSSMRDQAKRSANMMNRWAEITGGLGSPEERERTRRAHFLKGV
jgi:hypothetical protein